MLAQRYGEALHLRLERLAIVLGGLGADVAAGRKHVAMLANVLELARLQKPGTSAYSLASLSPRQAW